MPRQVFLWRPDTGHSLSAKPTVQVTKFGDGYEQRTRTGINSIREVWSLKFTRHKAEADLIVAFLNARGGVEAFDWSNPNAVLKTFVCREWSINALGGGSQEITANFEQVFEA